MTIPAPPQVPEDPLVAEMARFDLPEDEEQLELNMPWLKVVSKLSNSFNFHCTHQNFCHPNCYRRQMRATKRIMEAARHVSHPEKKIIKPQFSNGIAIIFLPSKFSDAIKPIGTIPTSCL